MSSSDGSAEAPVKEKNKSAKKPQQTSDSDDATKVRSSAKSISAAKKRVTSETPSDASEQPKSKSKVGAKKSAVKSESTSESSEQAPSKPKASSKKRVKSESDTESSEAPKFTKKLSPKKSPSKNSPKKKRAASSDEDDEKVDLGNNRILSINEFKGKVLVDIREFYMDSSSGAMRPGKKGISLSAEQWKNLLDGAEKINSALDRR